MRPILIVLIMALAGALAPSAGHARSCPASALKASTAVWPFNALVTGQTKSAMHPCGRQITCTGGKWGPPQVLRQCHWG